jgi:hypothetical protein
VGKMAESNRAVVAVPMTAVHVDSGNVRLLSPREDWAAIASLALGSFGVMCG